MQEADMYIYSSTIDAACIENGLRVACGIEELSRFVIYCAWYCVLGIRDESRGLCFVWLFGARVSAGFICGDRKHIHSHMRRRIKRMRSPTENYHRRKNNNSCRNTCIRQKYDFPNFYGHKLQTRLIGTDSVSTRRLRLPLRDLGLAAIVCGLVWSIG